MALRERARTYIEESFHNQTIRVDGNSYQNCVFYDCTLEFAATALPQFDGCRFANSSWIFVGPASNMITFLSQLPEHFGKPGKDLLEGLFKQLQQGPVMPADPPVLLAEAKGVAGPVPTIVSPASGTATMEKTVERPQ
jgi:hypothetical protein